MARQTSFKKEKIEEKIVQIVNSNLRQKLRDPRLKLASVTRAEVSSDYQYAKIYWDCFQPEKKQDIAKAFTKARGTLRSNLAQSLQARVVPELQFLYDSKFEDENQIEKLLQS